MLNQYELMYRNIGDLRYVANADDDYKIYELKKEIGQVFIEQHFLANQVVVTIYDYKLDHDVITDFDLSNDYFEIEYCISGEIYIKSQQGISVFKSNELRYR